MQTRKYNNGRKDRFDRREDRRDDRRETPTEAEEDECRLEGRKRRAGGPSLRRTIDKVFVASGEVDHGLQRLAQQAKEAGAVVVSVDRRKLDTMSVTHAHQGHHRHGGCPGVFDH